MHTPTFIADWQIVDGCMIIYFIFFSDVSNAAQMINVPRCGL